MLELISKQKTKQIYQFYEDNAETIVALLFTSDVCLDPLVDQFQTLGNKYDDFMRVLDDDIPDFLQTITADDVGLLVVKQLMDEVQTLDRCKYCLHLLADESYIEVAEQRTELYSEMICLGYQCNNCGERHDI